MTAIPPPYHLERTLQSGQCFRWTLSPEGARGIIRGTISIVRQDAGRLRVGWDGPRGSTAGVLRHLGANEPLEMIEAELARDRVLRRLLPHTSGIALMRQDPWETLVSFVISAFNNIPKIQLTIDRLSRAFGDPIAGRGALDTPTSPAWTFPTSERLAGAPESSLRACLLGYRAPYIQAIARQVADGRLNLTVIRTMPCADARAALLELPGVGEKVVECVLLFAFGHHDSFPVDVWVQRAVERWYLGGRARTPREIRAWARDRFGPLAGYAQQHLFAGSRIAGLTSTRE